MDLNYFIGKTCTIFTLPFNRDFKSENPTTFPEPLYNYFLGKILEIDKYGILVEQVISPDKLRSYFFLQHIISIAEEQQLDPRKPEDAEIIKEIKSANQVREEIPKPKVGQFIDIKSFTDMSKKLEETYGKPNI